MKQKRWTVQEKGEMLRLVNGGANAQELTDIFEGRTARAVQKMASQLKSGLVDPTASKWADGRTPWTDEERTYLADPAMRSHPADEIALLLFEKFATKRSVNSINNERRRLRDSMPRAPQVAARPVPGSDYAGETVQDWRGMLARNPTIRLTWDNQFHPSKVLTVPKQAAMVCSDLHFPKLNRVLAMQMLILGAALGCRSLWVGGDIVDGAMYSRWDALQSFTREDAFDTELSQTREFIRIAWEYTDNVAICMGNHDNRFNRIAAKAQMEARVTASLFAPPPERGKSLDLTMFTYFKVDPGANGQRWAVTHDHNYSRNPGTVENKLALVNRTSILKAHNHMQSRSWDWSGNEDLVSLGCMAGTDNLDYTEVELGTLPKMNQGFALFFPAADRSSRDTVLQFSDREDWTFWEAVFAEQLQGQRLPRTLLDLPASLQLPVGAVKPPGSPAHIEGSAEL